MLDEDESYLWKDQRRAVRDGKDAEHTAQWLVWTCVGGSLLLVIIALVFGRPGAA